VPTDSSTTAERPETDEYSLMLRAISPMLVTSDVPASVNFYVAVLGFERGAASPDAGWGCVTRDGLEIMFSRPNAHEHPDFSKATFTGSSYLRVDDVDAEWARIKDRVRVGYPIENFGYGMREFAVYDNNGYLIQFGQAL